MIEEEVALTAKISVAVALQPLSRQNFTGRKDEAHAGLLRNEQQVTHVLATLSFSAGDY